MWCVWSENGRGVSGCVEGVWSGVRVGVECEWVWVLCEALEVV